LDDIAFQFRPKKGARIGARDTSKAGKKPFSIGVNLIDRGFHHDPAAARCDVKAKKKILYRC
jgi:hypothetical protein